MSKKKPASPAVASATPADEPLTINWRSPLTWQYDPSRGGYKVAPGTAEWRGLRAGDLVLTHGGGTLAQVRGLVDGYVRLALLHSVAVGDHYSAGTYAIIDPSDVRLLPPLPLKVSSSDPPDGRDWVDEGSELYVRMPGHLPPNHPVRAEFAAFFECDWFEGENEDAWEERQGRAEVLVRRFYDELPQAQQRAILAGWTPRRARPSSGALGGPARWPVRLAVELYGQPLTHAAEWKPTEASQPARVILYAGHSKADVLKNLRDALAYVDQHWDRIVDTEPTRVHGGEQ